MSDLLVFLRARLDEDEANAEKYPRRKRALLEVTAKRRLITVVLRGESRIDGEWGCSHSAEEIAANQCYSTNVNNIEGLQLLALPYEDHAEYNQEWFPDVQP